MPSRLNPVRNAPSIIHAVALVGLDVASTEQNIRNLMRGFPPAYYKLANQLVRSVLKGRSLAWARAQARRHMNEEQRKQARIVLIQMTPVLRRLKPEWVVDLDVDPYQVGPRLQLPVKVHGLMKVNGKHEVLVMHLWQKGLSEKSRNAAASILKDRLSQREELANAELRWIDISMPFGERRRSLREYNWGDINLMPQAEMERFLGILREAWDLYLERPEAPRKPRPNSTSDQPTLFDRTP